MRRGQIDHMVRSGRWIRLHDGIYVNAALDEQERRETEVRGHLHRCGPTALLSHHSAAGIHGLDTTLSRPDGTWIAVTHNQRMRLPNVQLTRSVKLRPDDVDSVDGWPVTGRARTVLDLASHLEDRELERVLESALRGPNPGRPDLWRPDVLAATECFANGDRRIPGAGALARVLALRPTGCRPTGSIGETAVVQALRDAGISGVIRQPTITVVLPDGTIHRLFPDILVGSVGLILEIDGEAHALPQRRRSDLARQNKLMLGFTIFRYPATAALFESERIATEVADHVHGARRLGPSWRKPGTTVSGADLAWTLSLAADAA